MILRAVASQRGFARMAPVHSRLRTPKIIAYGIALILIKEGEETAAAGVLPPAEASLEDPHEYRTAAQRGGTRTPLSCALCEPQRAHSAPRKRRLYAPRAATRSLSSRRDR